MMSCSKLKRTGSRRMKRQRDDRGGDQLTAAHQELPGRNCNWKKFVLRSLKRAVLATSSDDS